MSVSQEKIESDMKTPQASNNKKPQAPARQRQVCGASISHCNYRRRVGAKTHRDTDYTQFEKFEMQ